MSKVRLYIRSIHRAVINQWTVFINIKDLFLDLFQIVKKKEKINQIVSLNKKNLEKSYEIINSGTSIHQSKVINFIR